MRLSDEAVPEVSPGKQARGVEINGHVGDELTYAFIFHESFAADFRFLAVLHHPLH